MRTAAFLMIAMLVALPVSCTSAGEREGFEFKKQPELQQPAVKKPVKIKLKRSSKDEYAWELSGDDVDEVVKTDRKLRKMLNVP